MTTKQQHTPGPWMVDGIENYTWILANDSAGKKGQLYLAEIIESDEEGKIAPAAQRKANARLIAAAPELLAACKNLLYLGERMEQESGELDPTIEVARAAIAKAEGR